MEKQKKTLTTQINANERNSLICVHTAHYINRFFIFFAYICVHLRSFAFSFAFCFFTAITPTTHAAEWSGNIAAQSRYFPHQPLSQNTEQHNNYLSASTELEFYHGWDDDNQSLTFTPFFRIDQFDDERTHGDIRELVWLKVFDSWQLKTGISKVYWGVTESQHLVDVINQTDSVENIDGEDKLGQPMIHASFEKDWGIIDLFILPVFRERTFSDPEGRPRTSPYVDTDQAQYESSDKENHIDYALRWFHILGDWEVGISHFEGTSREPVLQIGSKNGQPILVPFYPQMSQSSIDIQATTEDWLWKLEAISRDVLNDRYFALTGGTEYTFIGILESDADLGIVVEYLYDNRDKSATTFLENDIMMGLRLAMNDAQSTEALLGFIVDADTQEALISLEASRRLGDNWKLEFEIRSFQHIENGGLLSTLKNDGLAQLDISFYF
jgi:hypothetical protein